MKEENCGVKDKRKILVEFDIPEKFSHYTENDFKMKFNAVAHVLKDEWEISSEFFYSAKPIRLSDSKTYDTIP